MFSYNNLWKLLIDKKMNKKDLRELANITSSTMAKMGKGEPVSLEIIARICKANQNGLGTILRAFWA